MSQMLCGLCRVVLVFVRKVRSKIVVEVSRKFISCLPLLPLESVIDTLAHPCRPYVNMTGFFLISGDNEVKLTEFEASPKGMIASFSVRFPGQHATLEDLWRAEKPFHNYQL